MPPNSDRNQYSNRPDHQKKSQEKTGIIWQHTKPATAVEFMRRISNLGNGAERPSIPSKVDLRISKDNAESLQTEQTVHNPIKPMIKLLMKIR